MKKSSIKFVLVAFVIGSGIFAVPCLASYASVNHSDNMETTFNSVDGSNQNSKDVIKQRIESIIQECMYDTAGLYDNTSRELKQLLIKVNKIDYEVQQRISMVDENERYKVAFWDFNFWTGGDISVDDYDILKIQSQAQESASIKVQFKGTDSDFEKKQTEVTIQMVCEDGEWLIDDIYNLKDMLSEYLRSGNKIPVRNNDDEIKSQNETADGAFNVNDNDEQPKDDPCDRIVDAYSKCTDLCEAAGNSNDNKEKKKLFMEAYNINKKLVADPTTSECFPNNSFIKDNLEYIEGRLKDLGVEF